jgi:myosin heavy subunit
MSRLPYLHEPAILFNLRLRFKQSLQYTNTGDIVIAVNPYTWHHQHYTEEVKVTPHNVAIELTREFACVALGLTLG